MNSNYLPDEPTRAEVDALPDATLLEFGSPHCGHCLRAAPLIEAAIAAHPGLRHLKVFDGPGQPLGRSYRVKLWPTLILMRDGAELARVVRPQDASEIAAMLDPIAPDES